MDTSACTAGPGEGTLAINKDNQFGWGTAWRLHYLWQFLRARLRRALFQRVFIWLCVLLLSFIIHTCPHPFDNTTVCRLWCVNVWIYEDVHVWRAPRCVEMLVVIQQGGAGGWAGKNKETRVEAMAAVNHVVRVWKYRVRKLECVQ